MTDIVEQAALITTAGGLEALPVGTVIRTQSGAVAVKHDTTDYPWRFADDTQDRFTNIGMIDCHTWPFTVLHQPGTSSARTVPTRRQIADVLSDHWISDPSGGTSTGSWCDCTCGAHITTPGIRDIAARLGVVHQSDAVLALLAGQPTVAEVKAAALEEAANSDDLAHWLADRRNGAAAAVVWLRERAQQHRDGE